MTRVCLDLVGAEVLTPDAGLVSRRLSLADGRVVAERVGREVDLAGYKLMPGIVDLHGDGFERHLAPRRGAMDDIEDGVIAAEAELASNGITTAVMAQFYSWEGGLRGPDHADRVFRAIAAVKDVVVTDLIPQLRFETHMLDAYDDLPRQVAEWGVGYVVFNDHLPHDRLAEGRHPPRLTGQALKAGRNPERHFEMLLSLHRGGAAVPHALDRLAADLAQAGVLMGSHDDHRAADRLAWRKRGVRIAEFPETVAAAEAAHAGGDAIILGAPNAVRGASHKGNASALDLISSGLCDALASDYHYPSLRRAALALSRSGLRDLAGAWHLVSAGPARVLGLLDRGQLAPGCRADLVVLDPADRVAATLCGGRFGYLSGDVAARFMV